MPMKSMVEHVMKDRMSNPGPMFGIKVALSLLKVFFPLTVNFWLHILRYGFVLT